MGSKSGSGRRDETLEDVSHVFLDVGGTLLYSEPSASDILHRIFAARGHLMDRERIARLLRTPETIVTFIRPFPAGRENEFFREMNARIVEHLGLAPDDAMLREGEPPAPCPQVRSLEGLADLLGVRRSPP